MSREDIPGYTLGEESVSESPISMEEFERLKETVMFTEEDEAALRTAGEVLEPQIDDVLDLWYEFVGSHDFLLRYFSTPEGEPIDEYLDRVRARFARWIRDTCDAPYGQDWLDYQYEIALRHTREKKNETDGVDAVPHIDYRYVVAFVYPITATVKDFLANGDHDDAAVEAMYDAWFKSIVLQVTLWSYPYVKDGDF
ncbi:protoglobin domain-containing protein [Halegenticoccus tardaugens]|uniref:protoglobin domain-containing protein n=1 Tax=Halegenticoccus tardaugens TaxID=2071624 RepID=UPI00100AAED7|nr:protoglobin domain-containing protein [Halegenticoccus tardaugens]